MASSVKRKQVNLSIEQKLRALKRLDKGESFSAVAKAMGVGKSTIRDWKKKRTEIESWCVKRMFTETLKERKSMTESEFNEVNEALYIWFRQRREKGMPVSGPILQEKALKFYEQFKKDNDPKFVASTGWLDRWKKRYEVRQLSGEKLSGDTVAVSCPDDSLIQNQDFLLPIKSEPVDPGPSTSDSQHSFQSPRTSARRQPDWNIAQVPQQVPPSSGNQQQKSAAPQMPILKKAPMPQQTVMPSSQQQAKLQSMKQVRGVSPPHQPPPPPPPPAVVAPPEVCLRWNSYHSNMQATFPNLLTNEQFVDVTLACEGRSIKCHKVILSACSAYFEDLLSANPCQHPIVLMKDLRYWEVQALVDFMYRGEVNVGQDKLPSLLAAAEALQIKGLAGPASTSSSHDEDSLPPPMTPSSLEDFLDESVPSPSSARRARKRRMMSAMQSQTQQSPQSSSMAPLRLRQQQRSSAPVPSTSSYRHESTPDEPPPLRRARRSEAPMEIKIEPIDIDESNDSITDADDVYDGKKFNTVPQHDGHDNGQNLSPEQKSHLDVSNQNDFSGPSSSNNMLSHSDLHSYPFEPGSIKDTANKRISDTGYVDDPMNPAASSSDHNVLAESGGSEESILGHV